MSNFWHFLKDQRVSSAGRDEEVESPITGEKKQDTLLKLENELSEQKVALEILVDLLLRNKTLDKQVLINKILERKNTSTLQVPEEVKDEVKIIPEVKAKENEKSAIDLKNLKAKSISDKEQPVKKVAKVKDWDSVFNTSGKNIDLDFADEGNLDFDLKKIKTSSKPEKKESTAKKAEKDWDNLL